MWRPRLVVLQPTPYCNISCTYCYLGRRDDRRVMSDAVLEAVREKIFKEIAPDAAPTVVWHAGEPTAVPISWYDHAYERLAEVTPEGASFAMQSNGVAINDEWVDLFLRTNTSVGLSIDGPQRFHDARRRTRNGKPTWHLAIRALELLQRARLDPNVICVLHPDGLEKADEYYRFCREHGITQVSFSIDELEGANGVSSFSGRDYKQDLTAFLAAILERAYSDHFPLHIREIERIATVLTGSSGAKNEQIEPWDTIIVGAEGGISTFSPELMEVASLEFDNFVFGNILEGDLADFTAKASLREVSRQIASGVSACQSSCRYFPICGGGAPVNKMSETGRLDTSETIFCRLSVQAAADALASFLANREKRRESIPASAAS